MAFNTISFTVPGEPKGKARAKTVRLNNGASHTYTPEQTVLYENLIITEYRRQCGGVKFADGAYLKMRVKAYFAIPKSKPKATKQLMRDEVILPIKKPDVDNILKVVSDALNKIAYNDDSQIVDGKATKFYGDIPRVEITITEVTK